MSHLTSDELIEAVEGTLAPSRRRHLAECADCTREVGASAVLKERRHRRAEPSPLFWDHFSARVRAAVHEEPLPAGAGWGSLLRWPVMVPVAALAIAVLAVVVTRTPDAPPVTPNVTHAAADADPSASPGSPRATSRGELSDEGWTMVAELVGTIDLETADASGVAIRPGTAELAALELNAQEQQELGRLIRAELERAKS